MKNCVKIDEMSWNETKLCYIGDDEMLDDIGFFDMKVYDNAIEGFHKVLREEAWLDEFRDGWLVKLEDCFRYNDYTYIPYERLTNKVREKMWEFYDGYLSRRQIEELIENGSKCYLKGSGHYPGQLVFSNIEKMFN